MNADTNAFRRVAILGTGLIGGSFGLALRKNFPQMRIAGWDKESVLSEAEARGAIHEASPDLSGALAGAELVYVALPVKVTLELLPEIARGAESDALVTDACSTKAMVCRLASECFRGGARFLGGHPLTGKEVGGIPRADAELFRGTKYALMGTDGEADSRVRSFVALLAGLGACPEWLDAETHDWAVAIVSHLPQLVAVALAEVVGNETDETGLPLSLAGPGLRDMLRLAGSSYEIWRDIVLTNPVNIARALDRVIQALEHLRTGLAGRELADEFAAANELYKMLQDLQ